MRGVALGVLLAMLAVAGCGGDDAEGPPKVVIRGDGYEPADLRIDVGERVTFVNRDPTGHPHSAKDTSGGDIEVSPAPGPTAHDGSEVNRASHRGFATHSLFTNEAQRVVFPVAGRYEYYCAFDSDMKGSIEVVEP